MLRILRRLLQILGLMGLATVGAAAVVALWHSIIETPQPLESLLPGENRIYHWKYGNIFYKVLGSLEAPPLVLLHAPGIAASSFEMRKIMQPLAQHYCVYVPDLLGFGLSDRPGRDYSAETYITLCHDFLAEVVREPATLLASELSCNYAVAIATRSPRLCSGLILISPIEIFATKHVLKSLGLLTELITSPAVGLLLYPLLCTRPALRFARKGRYNDYRKSDLDYLYATTHQLGAHHAPLAYVAGKLANEISQEMETLQQPTLIIWGTQELNSAHSLHGQLPMKSMVILLRDSDMYVHEECPEAVMANIEEWSKEGQVALTVGSKPVTETRGATVSNPSATEKDAEKVTDVPRVEMGEIVASDSAEAEEDVEEPVNTRTIEAYCAKCKKKVPMQDAREVTMKNGRPALRGTCPVCGTGLFRAGRG
jgi:pimeloyl-ACP methyl ester carboxylesterase